VFQCTAGCFALQTTECLAAQAGFDSLSDDLIRGIVGRAWAQRPAQPAMAEVRSAVDLLSLCRRVHNVLLAQPLPLALDFSGAPLSKAQRKWLAADIPGGYVEAATFNHKDSPLWSSKDLRRFLARYGGSLQKLAGVPLRLVSSRDSSQAPPLDLTSLSRLTSLGIHLPPRLIPQGQRAWFARASWPQGLLRLELVGVGEPGVKWLDQLAWAACPATSSHRSLAPMELVHVSGTALPEDGPGSMPQSRQHPQVLAISARCLLKDGWWSLLPMPGLGRTMYALVRSPHACVYGSGDGKDAPTSSRGSVVRAAANMQVTDCGAPLQFVWCWGHKARRVEVYICVHVLIRECFRQYALEICEHPTRMGELSLLAWRPWPPEGSAAWRAAVEDHAHALWWLDQVGMM